MESEHLSIHSVKELLSGEKIPALGFGVYRNQGPTVVSACSAALEAGYRHIDSAQLYGNEMEVAEALSKSGLKREEVFITTKILSKDWNNVASCVQGSLQRFSAHDTDGFTFGVPDLLLIHDPRINPEDRLSMWKDVLKARDDGFVKSVGVSNFAVRHLEQIVAAGLELPVVNQIELHPFCQRRDIVEWCTKRCIVVEAYCPLVRGKYWDNPTLLNLSNKYQRDIGHILVRWSLQKGHIPLPKSSRPHRIKSNANVYDFHITIEDMEALDALDEGDNGAIAGWNPPLNVP
ncbi:hypothetical protein FRC15_010721 [Serendipita sp. 397]|nr:hypothetical protein FRC15_010721 [Serendipita sp. 397]KAG8802341.1 hypothetical protein FRC16_009864 [Serendipita sp. 398]